MINRKRVINLDSDEEEPVTVPRHRKRPVTKHPIIFINDSDGSDGSERLGEKGAEDSPGSATGAPSSSNAEDYTTDDDLPIFLRRLKVNSSRTTPPPPRRQPIETILEDFSLNGKIYRRGKSVELVDGTFLRIHTVVKIGEEVFLRGYHFRRCEQMESLVPRRTNEVCLIVELTVEEVASGLTSKTTQIPLSQVKQFRLVRLTNHRYSSLNHQTTGLPDHEGYLFCRLKYLKIWETGRKNPVEEAILLLSFSDTDKGYGIQEDELRENWRGITIRGGSSRRPVAEVPITIDLDGPVESPSGVDVAIPMPPTSRRQYTFGDGFCGAGGMSCGARQAGLWISWGFDKSHNAMRSYRLNFQDAVGETSDVADFLANSPEDIIADIIHASPPCPTFSPAHTVMAQTDEANEACLFSVRRIVELGKPRIFTMEETFGLQDRHEPFLFATIHALVELGYSIRWRQLNCSAYGVPQNRKRLVVIAAGYATTPPEPFSLDQQLTGEQSRRSPTSIPEANPRSPRIRPPSIQYNQLSNIHDPPERLTP